MAMIVNGLMVVINIYCGGSVGGNCDGNDKSDGNNADVILMEAMSVVVLMMIEMFMILIPMLVIMVM